MFSLLMKRTKFLSTEKLVLEAKLRFGQIDLALEDLERHVQLLRGVLEILHPNKHKCTLKSAAKLTNLKISAQSSY